MCRLHFGLHVTKFLPKLEYVTKEQKSSEIKFQENLFSESRVVTYRWTHTVQLTGTFLLLFGANMPQKAKCVMISVHTSMPEILHHGPNSFPKRLSW
jgi:hypothetical protein